MGFNLPEYLSSLFSLYKDTIWEVQLELNKSLLSGLKHPGFWWKLSRILQ